MHIKTVFYGLISALFLNVFTSYGLITHAVLKQHIEKPDHFLVLLSDQHLRAAETERQKKQLVVWGNQKQQELNQNPSHDNLVHFIVEDQMNHKESANPILVDYFREWREGNQDISDDASRGPCDLVAQCWAAGLSAIDVDFRALKGALEDGRTKYRISPIDFQRLYSEQSKIIKDYNDTPFLDNFYKATLRNFMKTSAPIMKKLYSYKEGQFEYVPKDLAKLLLSSEFEVELVDPHVAHEVYQNRNKKFIVIYLGGRHLDNLENNGIWDHLGYKTVFNMGARFESGLGKQLFNRSEFYAFWGKFEDHVCHNPVDLKIFFDRCERLRLQQFKVFKKPVDDLCVAWEALRSQSVKEIAVAEAKAEEEAKLRADEVEIIGESRKRKVQRHDRDWDHREIGLRRYVS